MEISSCTCWQYCRTYELDCPTSSTNTGIRGGISGGHRPAAEPPCIFFFPPPISCTRSSPSYEYLVVMRRDLNTCSRQSAMHHGVRVRVFFRRSSEHHSRNDSSSTSWSHDVGNVLSRIRTRYFLRALCNIHHHVNQRSKLHTVQRTGIAYSCRGKV